MSYTDGMSIIEKAKQLGLPAGQYVVVGSGTLEVFGIRPAKDLDIAVLPKLHAKLRATGLWKEEIRYNKIFLQQEGVEILPDLHWDKYPGKVEDIIASATIIDGVPFMNLEELRRFKLALGREKDFEDIKLIDAYIQRSNN